MGGRQFQEAGNHGQSRHELIAGFACRVVESSVSDPTSQESRVAAIILLVENFDVERNASLGVVRGTQWWALNQPVHC